MAGPRPSPWTRLLLAALLSISFPGDMGESGAPLQHLSWWGHTFMARPSQRGLSRGVSPGHSAVQQLTTWHREAWGATSLDWWPEDTGRWRTGVGNREDTHRQTEALEGVLRPREQADSFVGIQRREGRVTRRGLSKCLPLARGQRWLWPTKFEIWPVSRGRVDRLK